MTWTRGRRWLVRLAMGVVTGLVFGAATYLTYGGFYALVSGLLGVAFGMLVAPVEAGRPRSPDGQA